MAINLINFVFILSQLDRFQFLKNLPHANLVHTLFKSYV